MPPFFPTRLEVQIDAVSVNEFCKYFIENASRSYFQPKFENDGVFRKSFVSYYPRDNFIRFTFIYFFAKQVFSNFLSHHTKHLEVDIQE